MNYPVSYRYAWTQPQLLLQGNRGRFYAQLYRKRRMMIGQERTFDDTGIEDLSDMTHDSLTTENEEGHEHILYWYETHPNCCCGEVSQNEGTVYVSAIAIYLTWNSGNNFFQWQAWENLSWQFQLTKKDFDVQFKEQDDQGKHNLRLVLKARSEKLIVGYFLNFNLTKQEWY